MVRQRPAKPCTRVRFPSPPPLKTRAISSAGERFPDTEEVTGSIPVSRTTVFAGQPLFDQVTPPPSAVSAEFNSGRVSVR